MTTRFFRLTALLCVAVLLVGLLPGLALAQDSGAGDGARFESTGLGVAFDLPDAWQVIEEDDGLIAGLPNDLAVVQDGGMPATLTVRMVFGTFNQLGITDATELPALLARLVASDVTAPVPERVEWGNASGYQSLITLPGEGLTTRVALLAIAGGRVAIVRGLAPTNVWQAGGETMFLALADSLIFSLPERDANFMAEIPGNDGGVLWHFISRQPDSGRVVNLGGITFDQFDVMYIVAGQGGVLALQMPSGAQISYMGPWYSGNFVDVAIGPDTKLYTANPADGTTQAIMVVDRAGNWTRAWGVVGDGPGDFAPGMPQTIVVTPANEVWTVSEGHSSGVTNRLYKFDAFGNLLLAVDLDTINRDLRDVRLDNNILTGAIYMVGADGNLNVVDQHGEALVVNLAQEVLHDQDPVDIAIAPNGNIIVALPAPGLEGEGFLELSVAGQLLDVFGFPYDEGRGGPFLPGEYLQPAGLIVGPDGTVYWTETHPQTGYNQVQRFTFTGDGVLPLGAEMAAGETVEGDLTGSSDPARGGGSLAYGQSVRGALNNRYPSHSWTFEGTAGDHIIITMVDASGAGLIDPMLYLLNVEGRDIAANDDVGALRPDHLSERDAMIDFVLPSSGVFMIEAGRFGGRGDYILSLEKVD